MKNWFYLIIAFLGMGAFYPFVHNYIFFGSLKTLVSLFFIIIWAVFLALSGNKIVTLNPVFNKILFIQCLFLFFSSVILDSSFLPLFYLMLSWVVLFLIVNTFTTDFFLKNFIKMNIISAVLCIVGTIGLAFGFLKLYGVYDYQFEHKILNFGLFFLKSSNIVTEEMRPAGYYDEPGSFAYVVMFLLLLNRKYFRNMKWEYALLFLPLITTSLAHIFTMLFFGVLFYINKKNISKLLLFAGITGVILFLILSGGLGDENSSFFKKQSVDRVERFINGEDVSRQKGFDLGPIIFEKHPWGFSNENVKSEYPDFVTDTFWGPLIYYGLLGIPFYFLPFLYILKQVIHDKDKIGFFMLLLVLINLIQRPYYMFPLFIVLLYYLFFNIDNKKEFVFNQSLEANYHNSLI